MSLVSASNNGHGKQPDVSIFIPVYNGYELTRAGMEALFADQSRASFEIIVVDNGSTDGVQDWLASLRGSLTLLSPGQNIGFAKANNLAAQQARGKYFVLLNNDTVPEPGWLDAMMETVERDADVAVVGCKLLYPETRLVQHAGVVVSDDRRPCHIYEYFTEDHPAVNKRRDFQIVTAACMLVRSVIFHEFGGFNEGFINGGEDVDFCLRVRERGWRVVYEPRAVALHFAGQSKGRHDFERHNAMLYTKLWGHKLVPDHESCLRADGFEVVRLNGLIYYQPVGVDLNTMLEQARSTLKDGDMSRALELYQEIYRNAPVSPTVVHYIASIHERRAEWDKAANMLKRLALLQPTGDVCVRLARVSLKMKEFAKAGEYAARALSATGYNSPTAAEALAIMGDAAFKSGKADEAETHYRSALAIASNHERALTGMGTVELSRQSYPAALPMFEQVLVKNPGHARATLGRGLCAVGQGKKTEAAGWLVRALELDPENSWALAAALPLLADTGALAQAHQLLERYLKRYPDDDAMALAQAGVAFKLGFYDQSRGIIGMIKDAKPNYPGVEELERELKLIAPQNQAVPAAMALV